MSISFPTVPKVIAFVDGSVDKNSAAVLSKGSAGVAFVRIDHLGPVPMIQEIRVCTEYAEGYSDVTNARMELLAFNILASASVLFFDENDPRSIPTWGDSEYALNILFNRRWAPKKNFDLISRVRQSLIDNKVTVFGYHVRGHQGFFFNELVDYACSQTWKNGQAIDRVVPIGKIPLDCSLCKFFPCIDGKRVNRKNWTNAFRAIKQGAWMPCDKRCGYADLVSSTQLIGPTCG